jgi:hypothetical protein
MARSALDSEPSIALLSFSSAVQFYIFVNMEIQRNICLQVRKTAEQ